VVSYFGLESPVNIARIRELLKDVETSKKITGKTRELLLSYLEFKSKATYTAYLVLNELSRVQ